MMRILEFLKGFLDEIFGSVGRGPRNNLLDFGGDTDHHPESGFLNPVHDRIQDFSKVFCLLLRFL